MRHYLIAIVLSVAPVHAAAQSGGPLPMIETQAKVRVWADSNAQSLKARVQSVSQESLEVSGAAAGPRVFHVSTLDRVDVSRGRNRWGWTAGGMLLGATAGVLITRAGNDQGDVAGGLNGVAEGLANTASGALVGGVVGFFMAPERWRTVWRR